MKKWGIRLAKEFPRRDSHAADRLMSKAIRALKKNDNREALRITNKLQKNYPKFTELWVPALAHVRLGQHREAAVILREIVARSPGNYSARNYLTLCLRKLGSRDSAKKFTEEMFARAARDIRTKRKRSE